jgi:AraC-like DNA-binding protein
MNLHETCHVRGECIEAHRHQRPYAAFVLEGAYEEAGPDGAWRLEAGDLILHPPFHLHLNRFERAGARVLNVTLEHGAACGIGLRDYAVMRPKAPDRLLRGLGRDAADALGQAMEDCARSAASPPRDWLDAFASDLRNGPRTPIADLARESGITPTHAARAFARRYGQTPASFRKEQRLRIALQMLAQRTHSLAQIAAAAGYADQSHMTRALAAATGATPSVLRAVLRQVDFVQDDF